MENAIPLKNMLSVRERSASTSTAAEGTTIDSSPFVQHPEERDHLLGSRKHPLLSQSSLGAKDSTRVALDSSKSSTFRVWWQELLLSIYAIGLLTTITAILSGFNKRSQPSWTLGLNLNTVIALLATFLRSGIGMVVEQILSQAKWTWQQRPRPLRDLARFDEASRGPGGSLLLWFKINLFDGDGRSCMSRHTTSALVATFVTILSLAIGSFTQQAVKPVVCTIARPGVNASLPVGYGDPTSILLRPGAGLWDLDAPTKARVFNALSGASYDRAVLIEGCTTGNCTFPDIAPGRTLSTPGFCSKCVDTTSLITERQLNVSSFGRTNELYLPNGLKVGPYSTPDYTGYLMNFDFEDDKSWISSASDVAPNTLQAWNVSALTVNMLALTVAGCDGPYGSGVRQKWNCTYPSLGFNKTQIQSATSWNAVGTTCVFYPCIQDIKAEVRNGRLSETVVDEVVVSNYSSTSDTLGMYRYPCYIDGVRYDEHNISSAHWQNDLDMWTGNTTGGPPDQCLYRVPFTMYRSLQPGDWLSDLFNGSCTMANNLGYGQYSRRWPLCEKWWLSQLYNSGNATFDNISATMNSVATAITDGYRLASINTRGITVKNTVNGTVWETTICTQFDWPWLLFPATLVILTVISLVLMMASTASGADRPPVWKSSILPLLYLHDSGRSSSLQGYHKSDMEERASNEKVKLSRDDQLRWRLRRTDESDIQLT